MINEKNSLIKYGWLRSTLCFIFFLLLFVLVSSGINTITISGNSPVIQSPSSIAATLRLLVSVLVVNSCFFLSAFLFRRFVDRKSFYSLGFKWERRYARIGLVTGASIIGLGTLLLWVIGDVKFVSIRFEPAFFFLNLLIFALVALGEELFFRGYILNNLLQGLNKWLALCISAVLFMLLHIQNAGASASILPILSVFVGGILFGIAYVFTKNLSFSVALHFIWNFLQGPVFGYDVSGTASRPIVSQTVSGSPFLTGGTFGFEGSIICVLLSITAVAVLISIFGNKLVVKTTA